MLQLPLEVTEVPQKQCNSIPYAHIDFEKAYEKETKVRRRVSRAIKRFHSESQFADFGGLEAKVNLENF